MVWVPGAWRPSAIQHYPPGPDAPRYVIRSGGAGERSCWSSPLNRHQIGAYRAGSIPSRLPESHRDAAFELGFSSYESGHFRTFKAGNSLLSRPITHSDGWAGRWPCGIRGRPPVRARCGPWHGPRGGTGDRPGCVSLWWPADGAPSLASGRLAQRESASFTPRRSLVRSQYRPPGISPGQKLQDRPHPPSRDGAFGLFGRNLGDQLLLDSQGWSGSPDAGRCR